MLWGPPFGGNGEADAQLMEKEIKSHEWAGLVCMLVWVPLAHDTSLEKS